MGLNQPRISPSDKVCILAGAEMPFVLREVEKGRFFLDGPAYVRQEAGWDGEYGSFSLC